MEVHRHALVGRNQGSRKQVFRTEANDIVLLRNQIHGRRAKKRGHKRVRRVVVNFFRRSDLPYHALVQNDDAISQGHRFYLVVSHVNGSGFDASMKLLELFAGRRSQLGIEIRERFVKKKHGGLANDRPRQRHALSLAAREFARLTMEQLLDDQQARGPLDLWLVLFLRNSLRLERERNVFVNGEMRIERVALEYHGDAALAWRQMRDVLPADQDLARGGRLQACDHSK